MMTKKFVSFTLGCLLLLTTACGQSTIQTDQSNTPHLTKIKVGHLVALDMAPLFLAKELNIFEKYGLDVETVFFSNPGDNNTALATGNIDIMVNPFTLPYFAKNSGIDMKIISNAGGHGVIEIVIQDTYDVHTPSELHTFITSDTQSKLKVGLLQGDTLEMVFGDMITPLGLTFDDFEIVWFQDLLSMVDSFKSEQIDILSHIKPYTTNLVVNHNAKVLTNHETIWGTNTPNCVVAVLGKTLETQTDMVENYLNATQEAFDIIINDPQLATDVLSKSNYYQVDHMVLAKALETQSKTKNTSMDINTHAVNTVLKNMAEQGYIKMPEEEIIVQ
jgi:ABC-type nitrate/sulfonate/bicarbonate transport system substrate-binding protein